MQSQLANFDAFLQESEADSSAWADGGGAEKAEEILAALSQQDWPQLRPLCFSRGAAWRGCLASILHPGQGEFAEQLMLALAWDEDSEVSFLALSVVAFNCGVNDSTNGPFIDLRIRNASFFSRAKATAGLISRIRNVSASCHPRFQRRLELLTMVLEQE